MFGKFKKKILKSLINWKACAALISSSCSRQNIQLRRRQLRRELWPRGFPLIHVWATRLYCRREGRPGPCVPSHNFLAYVCGLNLFSGR